MQTNVHLKRLIPIYFGLKLHNTEFKKQTTLYYGSSVRAQYIQQITFKTMTWNMKECSAGSCFFRPHGWQYQ